ncbi:double-stranded DNA-dependent ATPase [Martiniozyma asiatica (nom. inval.)]|nr:double-stranded DNA-dependent ATPase [Martiniozyma asiatica]
MLCRRLAGSIPLKFIRYNSYIPNYLRPYQQECLAAIKNTLSNHDTHKVAISIATGGGKTMIFCSSIPLLRSLPRYLNDNANGVLILVHRTELLNQTFETLTRLKSQGVEIGQIYKLTSKQTGPLLLNGNTEPFVIVAMVPTLARRYSKSVFDCFPMEQIKAVIIDECHHAVSASYKNILNHIWQGNGIAGGDFENLCTLKGSDNMRAPYLIGFSATLVRNDKLPLSEIFDKIVYQKRIDELVNENYLCNLEWNLVNVGLKLDEIETIGNNSKSDYEIESLNDHVNTPEINETIIKTYLKFKSNEKFKINSTLAFCVNKDHVKTLCKYFQINGITAQFVTADTDPISRNSIITDFKSGKIKVLLNCGIFTEGTDLPNIDSILLIRPTKSKPLLTQMIGRGLRLHHSKEKLIVIDFVEAKELGLTFEGKLGGVKPKVSLLGSGDLLQGKHSKYDIKLPADVEYLKIVNYKGIDSLLANESIYKEIKTKLTDWTKVKFDTWILPVAGDGWFEIAQGKGCNNKFTLKYRSRYERLGKHWQRSNEIISGTLDNILSKWKDIEKQQREPVLEYQKALMKMMGKPITPKQRGYLDKTIMGYVEKNARSALDIEKFKTFLNNELDSCDRAKAKTLITSFINYGGASVGWWVRKNMLSRNADRAKVTNQKIIDDYKNQVETGWGSQIL